MSTTDRPEDYYQWSKWKWNEAKSKWYRSTWINGEKIWDSQRGRKGKPPSQTAPRRASLSNDTFEFSTSTGSSDQYPSNLEYHYSNSSQSANSANLLVGQFARTTINDQFGSHQTAGHNSIAPLIPSSQYGCQPNTEVIPNARPIPIVTSQWQIPSTSNYSGSSQDTIDYDQLARENVSMTSGAHSPSQYRHDAPQPGCSGGYEAEPTMPHNSYGSETTVVPQTYSRRSSQAATRLSRVGNHTRSSANDTAARGDTQKHQQSIDTPAREDSATPTPIPKSIHKNIAGTRGKKEKLDEEFKVMDSEHWKPGRVFKVLWFEPKGEPPRSSAESINTEVTSFEWRDKYGQKVYSSVRRFVIVAVDPSHHSQCLPILTYGKRGTTKPGIKRNDHAIIYTEEEEPKKLKGEAGLRNSIRVIPDHPRHKLELESRLNYSKVYTVEHNVKVLFIGHVAKNHENRLIIDFDGVWAEKEKFQGSTPSRA